MKRRFVSVLFALALGAAFMFGRVSSPGSVQAAGAPPVAAAASAPAGGGCAGQIYTTNLSNLAFVPTNSERPYYNDSNGLMPVPNPASPNFFAPLSLPAGACFANVTFFVLDDGPGSMYLTASYRPLNGSTGSTVLAARTTEALPQTNTAQEAVLAVSAPVDPVANLYFVSVGFAQPTNLDQLLFGARVTYTLPAAYLPVVTR